MLETLFTVAADVRSAAKIIVAGRVFTVIAVICLALVIATNTTMFSVFDAMFLRPLPFKDADQLVSITGRESESGRRAALSLDDVRDLRSTTPALAAIAATSGRTVTLTDGGEPERLPAVLVTADLFATLGVQPQRGRAIEATDDLLSAAAVAVISDSLWRRRYQTDASAVGRAIRLDDHPVIIVGVMPPKFRFPSTAEIWIPMTPALGFPGRPLVVFQ